ncbi:MAG: MlaD family protein [Tannerella sp.]|jgi:phospholipid/cholesterol/gamma-HCH transport system substrate-binding protein|nr:MlaD family protein [Tannerella sp.]
MKAKFSKEVVIGIVTIICLALFYISVNYLKGINLFKAVNYYYVSCSNVKDVVVSSPVFVEGFKVGLVRKINYDYSTTGKITLEIHLDKGMKINKGSYVMLEKTLLSGAELHLKLNPYVNEFLRPGDTLEGRTQADMMASLQSEMLPQINNILPKLDSILLGLQMIVNHPAIAQSLQNIEHTTANLELSSQRLSSLLDRDIPVIAGNLKTTTENFAALSDEVRNLKLSESVSMLNLTLGNLNNTAARLSATDNSLGLLLNDTALYNTVNQTILNASDLISDLKANPKKYIHFSVF